METISTHTPLARRDWMETSGNPEQLISTHTPLARRDPISIAAVAVMVISTHTPLARRDLPRFMNANNKENFYSHASCEA